MHASQLSVIEQYTHFVKDIFVTSLRSWCNVTYC